ncbi:MAG: 16S rRNA (cytosine(967)-C(5))-methyltransferase RsmB [Clostridia bacterium]|nr:16S rRNA (cytosine(967)-C(5))-methyltransferase RsmB [Clostridia bacterium]
MTPNNHFRGDEHRQHAQNRPFGGDARRPVGQNRPFRGDKPAVKAVKPVPEGLAARRVALAVIRDVTENGAYASLSLDEHLTKSGLSPADRRLASRLAYDTLEQQLKLDWALDQIMARPDTDIKLRNVLRLGACQILLEDRIPESAATNTAVHLCREIGMDGLAGVCNGILRNLVRRKEELVWPDPAQDPVKARSIAYSVPEWLVRRLDQDWGVETANAIMACHAQESITVRPNLTRLDDAGFEALLNKKVWEHDKAEVPYAYHIRNMADIGQDGDFLGGLFSIQGESSMMACLALAPKRGSQVLDACAAPGGKACFLAEMMGGSGRVQAWELHDHRTKLIAAQAKRLGLENVRPITRDASVPRPELDATMDAVLLDAPCTGLGTMADKPDVKYRVTEESCRELAELQRKLLDALCMTVKPGGVMVYSTCSIMKAENQDQIAAFLERHPEFRLEPLPDTIPERFRAHEDVGLQLLPGRDAGVSGFYIARLRRARS